MEPRCNKQLLKFCRPGLQSSYLFLLGRYQVNTASGSFSFGGVDQCHPLSGGLSRCPSKRIWQINCARSPCDGQPFKQLLDWSQPPKQCILKCVTRNSAAWAPAKWGWWSGHGWYAEIVLDHYESWSGQNTFAIFCNTSLILIASFTIHHQLNCSSLSIIWSSINASTTNYCKLQGCFHFCHSWAVQVHSVFGWAPHGHAW